MERRNVKARERRNRPAKRRTQANGWNFGAGQTSTEERDELRQARRDGLETEYVAAQRWARMREAETERRREAKRARQREAASRQARQARRALVADLIIEAGKTPRGAWTDPQLGRWGITWPPPKGWRRELVARWARSGA
jgi:hypothetical protein